MKKDEKKYNFSFSPVFKNHLFFIKIYFSVFLNGVRVVSLSVLLKLRNINEDKNLPFNVYIFYLV